MSGSAQCVLLLTLLVLQVWAAPAALDARKPLSAVTELSSRLSSHPTRLLQEPRLPLPTPQDIEAIKKVAQILVMLGEQLRDRARPWWWIEMPSTLLARQALKGLLDPSDTKPKATLKVIPTILGDSPASPPATPQAVLQDPPNDPVN